jgi:hypothetical protein
MNPRGTAAQQQQTRLFTAILKRGRLMSHHTMRRLSSDADEGWNASKDRANSGWMRDWSKDRANTGWMRDWEIFEEEEEEECDDTAASVPDKNIY